FVGSAPGSLISPPSASDKEARSSCGKSPWSAARLSNQAIPPISIGAGWVSCSSSSGKVGRIACTGGMTGSGTGGGGGGGDGAAGGGASTGLLAAGWVLVFLEDSWPKGT